MSAGKIGCLLFYAAVAAVAISQAGTTAAMVALWTLAAIAVVHIVEMVLYYSLCRQAGGSLVGNLLQLFVFGYFHMIEMKASLGAK